MAATKATKKAASGKPAPKDSKAKAAKKAALQGAHSHASRKTRTSASFHRPKTLRLARDPKYPRKSIPHAPRMDQFRTIVSPLNTESAMKKIEEHNTLVFIVDIRSNKRQIKDAVKKLYDVQAAKINTLIRPDGKKKAYVRLTADHDALDVANKNASENLCWFERVGNWIFLWKLTRRVLSVSPPSSMFRIALARPPRAVLPSVTRWRRFNSNIPTIPPSEKSTTTNKVKPEGTKPRKGKEITLHDLVSEDGTLLNMSEEELETVFKEPPRFAETEDEMFGKTTILDEGRPTRLDPNNLPTPPLDPNQPCTEEQYAASLVHGRGVHIPIYHKPTYGIPVANIQFRSHHPELLDLFTHFATHAASSLGIPCSRPVFLPNKRTLWTVPRSPFAHKKSQENFERIVYKRAVKAWDADPEVIDRWFKYLRRHALGGVGMRTTKWERMALSVGQTRLENVGKLESVSEDKIKALGEKIVAAELVAQNKAKTVASIPSA
ncbi:hypothetical protein C0995_011084 [Termitomyces sp. Mi166|nr:hypothetical protein C0995_011084 [Termitomyces sp. Mi166\